MKRHITVLIVIAVVLTVLTFMHCASPLGPDSDAGEYGGRAFSFEIFQSNAAWKYFESTGTNTYTTNLWHCSLASNVGGTNIAHIDIYSMPDAATSNYEETSFVIAHGESLTFSGSSYYFYIPNPAIPAYVFTPEPIAVINTISNDLGSGLWLDIKIYEIFYEFSHNDKTYADNTVGYYFMNNASGTIGESDYYAYSDEYGFTVLGATNYENIGQSMNNPGTLYLMEYIAP